MSDEQYLIWDTRSCVGNSILWWGPKRSGYTTNVDEAGRYSKDEADHIHRHRPTDRPVELSIVETCITRHVTGDALRNALENP